MEIRLIAAIGRRGQLGLDNKMPWGDPEDLRWFRQTTMNSVVVMGHNTASRLALPNHDDRLLIIDGRNTTIVDIEILARQHGRRLNKEAHVYIAGGAKTYLKYLPHVRRTFLTHIDYDGPADVFMPALWSPS